MSNIKGTFDKDPRTPPPPLAMPPLVAVDLYPLFLFYFFFFSLLVWFFVGFGLAQLMDWVSYVI